MVSEEKIILEIDQPETIIAYGGHMSVHGSGQNKHSL